MAIQKNKDIALTISDYSKEDQQYAQQALDYIVRLINNNAKFTKEQKLYHYIETANILSQMRLDITSVVSGILHEAIDIDPSCMEDIGSLFGQDALMIISNMAQINNVSVADSTSHQAESIRRMILGMSKDIRVIFISLAERLSVMRNLHNKKVRQQKVIAQEVMDIYAPIASRLGIYKIKKELEDCAFKYLLSDKYAMIDKLIKKNKVESNRYVIKVKELILQKMNAAKLQCEVLGRNKHYFSIYNKMMTQNLPFEEIYDIIAFRIILETESQCYEALGTIHSMWKPIPNKIKDYIAMPKPNMYQALHTTVIGPKGQRIEIQIRTRKMDAIAKSGIAAHWGYKEGQKDIDEKTAKTYAWIQNLVENHISCMDPNEFLENVKIDLFSNEVYVFTPDGDIKTLPIGATALDFAYAIHSEVGNQCVGARVNGAIRPIKYQLKNGDRVEIITAKNHHPSKDCLNFVKTVKARTRIRQWIKAEEKERSLQLGRDLCDKEFRKHKLSFKKLLKSESFQAVLDRFNLKTIEDLIEAVGYGKITPLQIVREWVPQTNESPYESKLVSVLKKRIRSGVSVKGIDDVLVRFGKCCKPLPGDLITGYITRGYGVTVHKRSCINALKISPERQIDVEWNTDANTTYPVEIQIFSEDRLGLLADITGIISKNKANIISANTKTRDDKLAETIFVVSVKDTHHLDKVIKSINKIKNVKWVKRKSESLIHKFM